MVNQSLACQVTLTLTPQPPKPYYIGSSSMSGREFGVCVQFHWNPMTGSEDIGWINLI